MPVSGQDKCDVISMILDEKHLSEFISGHSDNFLIRITDLSDYFGNIKCGYNQYSVRVEDNIKIDLNSGRFIDICILSVNKKDELVDFEIFYVKRTTECKRDLLLKGKLVFQESNKLLRLIDSKFETIN